jgi:hypothetical protein
MKAQISMQFLMVVTIVFLFFIVFVSGFADRYRDIKMEKERLAAKDLALKVHDEIALAHNMEDGYTRTFTLPDRIEGANYTIGITGNYVAVTSEHAEYSLAVAPVTGDVQIGNNTISMTGGTVCLGC